MKPDMRISKHALLHWIEMVILVALFTGVLVLFNIIAYSHNRRFDLTPGKQFTLSPQAIQVLGTLTDDLTVTLFYKKGETGNFQDLLTLFSRTSDKFHYDFINLDKNPAKASSLGIKDYGSGIAEYKGRREPIRYLSEESIINAILRLTDTRAKVLYFAAGHGEKSIFSEDKNTSYSRVKEALELENYRVNELVLLQTDRIPEDTTALVISGPQKDYFPKELEIIDSFIQAGGRVMFLIDPQPLGNLEAYLKRYGIDLPHDFIIDRKSKLFELDELSPLVFPERRHLITSSMNEAVVFPLCRSVIPLKDISREYSVGVIAHSGPESWAERETGSVYDKTARFDNRVDIPGPVPVAVSVESSAWQMPNTAQTDDAMRYGLRLAVLGDSDFISNHYLNVLGNKDLFLNTVNWLAEKKELLTIRPKADPTTVSMLFLTENENRLILWSAVIIEPALVLVIGIGVMLWRRMKR